MHRKERFVHVEPLLGYISPQNGLYITASDIARAKEELAETGPAPRHEQRPAPFDPESLRKRPSQYIHT